MILLIGPAAWVQLARVMLADASRNTKIVTYLEDTNSSREYIEIVCHNNWSPNTSQIASMAIARNNNALLVEKVERYNPYLSLTSDLPELPRFPDPPTDRSRHFL